MADKAPGHGRDRRERHLSAQERPREDPPTDQTRLRLWRVFPWDPDAAPGTPFSATATPKGQGSGRFDVPHLTPVRYLAESPEHAVGERIQTLRGQRVTDADLLWHGRRLALVGATLTCSPADGGIVDLCDPQALIRFDCRPDLLASRDRRRTQAIAERLYAAGTTGFRWWSSVAGDWHATILFANRVAAGALVWDDPQPLSVQHDAVRAAAAILGIELS